MLTLSVILVVLQVITAEPIRISTAWKRPSLGIIGGDPADIEEFPHAVIFEYDGKAKCAGSIISEEFVILTAGCACAFDPSRIFIRAGSNHTKSGGTVHKAEQFIPHEKYVSAPHGYNIALVRVSPPFQYDTTHKAIPIFDKDEEIPVGTGGLVSGWGSTTLDGSQNEQLYKLNVTILDNEDCEDGYPDYDSVCAQNQENKGKDVCRGDWGDSLVVGGRLAAIQSMTKRSCSGMIPTTYTSVAHYRDWIDEHMQ